MKRALYFSIPLLVLLMLAACTYNVQITTKDTASWMNAIYNAQYKDYQSWFVKDAQGKEVLKPGVSEAQKNILVKKKAIFTKLHPLLITYSEYARTGIVPTGVLISDIETQAVKYVNDLIASEGGK